MFTRSPTTRRQVGHHHRGRLGPRLGGRLRRSHARPLGASARSPAKFRSRDISDKHAKQVPAEGGGIVEVELTDDERSDPCLTDDELQALREVGRQDRAPLRQAAGHRVGARQGRQGAAAAEPPGNGVGDEGCQRAGQEARGQPAQPRDGRSSGAGSEPDRRRTLPRSPGCSTNRHFSTLDLEIGDFKLRIRRTAAAGAGRESPMQTKRRRTAEAAVRLRRSLRPPRRRSAAKPAPRGAGEVDVAAPLLGNFYAAPRPGDAAVRQGRRHGHAGHHHRHHRGDEADEPGPRRGLRHGRRAPGQRTAARSKRASR